MVIKKRILILFCILIHMFIMWHVSCSSASSNNYSNIGVGVVLDSNSSVGSMVEVCMSMAISDFYAGHSDYKTRLFLHTQYAHNQLDVTSQVLELLQNEQVHGIVGSQKLTQGSLIEELAKKVQIPIISFTSRSQYDSDPQNQYFVRTTPDNSNQLKALAAICQGFKWNEVTILYEATESGREFFLELSNAFQVFDIRFASMISVSPLASDYEIRKDLSRVMTMQNRVNLVHMNPALGGRVFMLAKTIGMMEKDYAWIVTDSIGNFLNSLDASVIESMEGVIGIRSFVPDSKNLKSFRERLREVNVYGLLAYDTVWALALAAERVGPMKSSFSNAENIGNESYLSSLATSNFGPKLLRQLFDVKFEGLSGEFKLIDGKLKPSSLEIFNVIGTGGRTIGYWTPDGGISGKKPFSKSRNYSNSIKDLRTIVWPGVSVVAPIGWAIPSGRLKVGIPKKTGFTEFVGITDDPLTNHTIVTGYSIDIFRSALNLLPVQLEYDFMAFVDDRGTAIGTYTDLLHNISAKYDIIVGDFTINADRAKFVDFTLPYSESGIVMVVNNKQDIDMWVFFKPFRIDLWFAILATCIFFGIVLRILEHLAISNADNETAPVKETKGRPFWYPFSALAIPDRDMVNTSRSRFVLVVWLYMAYIVMQCYTAKLSSMFTVDQLNFKFSPDIYVGYQQGSFVKDFLVNTLPFNDSNLREYASIDQIRDGLRKGGKNGGFDAIMDEIPYVKILLNKHGSDYKMFGPTYKANGFGFAFPLGSNLVTYFSRAILNITEGPEMSVIEQKYFGQQYSSDNQNDSINKDNPSLTVYDFGGLFIIFVSAMILAILCSWTQYSKTFAIVFARHYVKSFLVFLSTGRKNSTAARDDHDSGQGGIQKIQQAQTNRMFRRRSRKLMIC